MDTLYLEEIVICPSMHTAIDGALAISTNTEIFMCFFDFNNG